MDIKPQHIIIMAIVLICIGTLASKEIKSSTRPEFTDTIKIEGTGHQDKSSKILVPPEYEIINISRQNDAEKDGLTVLYKNKKSGKVLELSILSPKTDKG